MGVAELKEQEADRLRLRPVVAEVLEDKHVHVHPRKKTSEGRPEL